MPNAIALARRVNKQIYPFFGPANLPGVTRYVSGTGGSNNTRRTGLNPTRPLLTVARAVALSEAFDSVFVDPGEYVEAIIIPRALNDFNLIGLGGRGAAWIAAGAGLTCLQILANAGTYHNIGTAADTAGKGVQNYGDSSRFIGNKHEGESVAFELTLANTAQESADTHGTGSDVWVVDCEFAWTTTGIELVSSTYGAITQCHFRDLLFHNCSAASIGESGASATSRFRNLTLKDCLFEANEDGTIPTKFLDLNDSNLNTGSVTRCSFPVAINSGNNLVSTKLLWAGNYHTGGLSGAPPS